MSQQLGQASKPARAEQVPTVRLGRLPRLTRVLLRWLLQRLFVIEMVGLEHVPRGRYLAAANHPGWLETFTLVACLPAERGLRMLASHAVTTGISWRRPIIAASDAILPLDLEHGDVRASIRVAVDLLKGGSAIGIFPEDLTHPTPPDGTVRQLRRGVAFLARASQSPVVPLGVPDTRQLWRGRRIRIVVGQPLPAPTSRAEAEALLVQLAERIEALRPRPEPLPASRPWPWLSNLF